MPVVMVTRCDGPGCETFMQTQAGRSPTGWLIINGQATLCSWTCCALYAAQNASAYEKPGEPAPPEGLSPEEPEPNGHATAETEVGATSTTG